MSAVPSALQSLESSTGLTGLDDFSNFYAEHEFSEQEQRLLGGR